MEEPPQSVRNAPRLDDGDLDPKRFYLVVEYFGEACDCELG
jgi:hypothetical protein